MTPEDFITFYREIHGVDPFPWQSNLVHQVVEHGSWPTLVDAPTGLGKTSVLDVAVFLMALSQEHKLEIGRRRIFFVVDRRVVVDQAEAHALKISGHLNSAPAGSVCSRVAARLRALSAEESGDVLPVVKMRGGATWEAAWLKRPDTPAIVTGTVDQVGSRLLFRGYGASTGRRPIDAALVGTDSLILVDEAHLSTVLMETLSSVRANDSSEAALGLPTPAIVRLSATATGMAGWVPTFDEAAHLADTTARSRLTAPKQLEVRAVAKAQVPKEMALAAKAASQPGSRVLVVCNTVDRARAVHGIVRGLLPASSETLLLTGRSRPLDRENVVQKALRYFGAGREQEDTSVVLVATQTVEVGVDLDATALITELASWDAIVQRLGRLNRRGLLPDSTALVFDDGEEKPPVYGPAATRTGEFLRSLGAGAKTVDVSPLALRALQAPADTLRPVTPAPLLLPAHLDAWARTSPAPVNDAPPHPYLHGIDGGVAAVTITWRDGLTTPDGERTSATSAGLLLDALPPRSEESIEIPIGAVRRWLVGERMQPVSDLDDDDDWEVPFSAAQEAPGVLRLSPEPDGESRWKWIDAADVRPGDSVVVPSELGGLDEFGWDPASTQPVVDLAELAGIQRGRLVLRLDHHLPARLKLEASTSELLSQVGAWSSDSDMEPETREAAQAAVISIIRAWFERELPGWDASEQARVSALLESATLVPLESMKRGKGFGSPPVVDSVLLVTPPRDRWGQASDERNDGTIHLSARVELQTHLDAVGHRAEEIANAIGLLEPLLRVVVDAARWHDLGKVDQRFQAMLFDGDHMSANLAPAPLAKSGMPPQDQARQRRARALSGMPRGARHEAWSEALVREGLATLQTPYEGDRELLLHLVASHHGHARPFLPAVSDDALHQLVASFDGHDTAAPLPRGTDLGSADRFARLNRRYGRWGLALLESVVRCADMTISEEGS